MTKNTILEFLKNHKSELKDKFGLTKIGLFGSYAKGTQTKDSDIDLAVEMEKKDFFLRDDLKEYLESSFETPVDIGYFDSFREFYKKKIERDIIYV